jgi:hypothetical protein
VVPYSVGFTYPGATCRVLGAHCSCPTLSYKRLGQAPLPRGRRKKRLRQGRLEHNTIQFSHGRRVLRSGGLNHVNLHVHCVHLELRTKRLKAFPTKEPQRTAPERLQWKCRKTTSTMLEERQHEMRASMGFETPEPVVYPPLPPPAVEDPWAWYRNARG